MRIPDGYSKRVTSTGRVRGRGATTSVVGVSGVVLVPSDSVEVSARAGEVSRARVLALQAPEIREPLVGEILGMIDGGQYHVAGSDVAPAMIRDHLQFAGSGGAHG